MSQNGGVCNHSKVKAQYDDYYFRHRHCKNVFQLHGVDKDGKTVLTLTIAYNNFIKTYVYAKLMS